MKKFLVMLVMLVGVFAMTGCGSSSLVGNIIKDCLLYTSPSPRDA